MVERAREKLETIDGFNAQFPAESFLTGDLTSLRTGEWRYQTDGADAELYALPDETKDVSEEHPDVAEGFADLVAGWLDSFGQPAGEAGVAEFTAEMED